MPAFDVFCLPSLFEGMPVALLEAMALGVPAVATAVGGTPEVVADGVTGRLVPPKDPAALAAALLQLLTDEGRRQAMGSAAHARAEARFSINSLVALYDRVYRGTMG
jgi:glycosyltransferase involved in cell wall biosynthesis